MSEKYRITNNIKFIYPIAKPNYIMEKLITLSIHFYILIPGNWPGEITTGAICMTEYVHFSGTPDINFLSRGLSTMGAIFNIGLIRFFQYMKV